MMDEDIFENLCVIKVVGSNFVSTSTLESQCQIVS